MLFNRPLLYYFAHVCHHIHSRNTVQLLTIQMEDGSTTDFQNQLVLLREKPVFENP